MAILSEATTQSSGNGQTTTQASSNLKAGNQVNVTALGDVTLAGAQDTTILDGGNDTTTVTTTQTLKLKGENVNIQGVGQSSNVSLQGVEVDASNKAKVAGTDNVVIASGEDRMTQVGSVVKGGQSMEVTSGKDLTTVTSWLESGGDLTVNVGGKANYLAALNVERHKVQSNSSSSWGGRVLGEPGPAGGAAGEQVGQQPADACGGGQGKAERDD